MIKIHTNSSIMKSIILFLSAVFLTTVSLYSQNLLHILERNTENYPEVNADVFTFDNLGVPILYNQGDYIVRDNGRNVSISNYFCPEQNPVENVSLTFLFDNSLDLLPNDNYDIAKSMATDIIDISAEGDEFSIVSYDFINYLHQSTTSDKFEVLDKIQQLNSSASSFLDVGFLNEPANAIRIANFGVNKKSIILFMDSNPDASFNEIIDLANQNEIAIYLIGINVIFEERIKTLAESTGGRWFDQVNSANYEKVARSIYSLSKGYLPCNISWTSNFSCDDIHEILISVPAQQANDEFAFEKEVLSKPIIISEPEEGLGFSSVPIGGEKVLDITIVAKTRDMFVNAINLTDDHFEIVSGDLNNEILAIDQPHTISIRFTPTDSAIVFSKLIVDTDDACDGQEIFITGGYPNTPPNEKTIEIVRPQCNETLLTGDQLDVAWVGLLPKDVVQIFFSSDNGATWDTLAKNTTGLTVDWQIPQIESDECLIRILQLWPNNVGQTLDLQHFEEVNSAFFNEDGSLVVSASDDSTAIIWNANNGEIIHVLRGHKDQIIYADFSDDSRYVITASGDSSACLWDVTTGELVARYDGHTNKVSSAHVSPDGTKALTSSWDGTARIWDLLTGEELQVINANPGGNRTWFSDFEPNGQFIITCGNEKLVKMWNINTGELVRTFDTRPGQMFGNVKHCIFNETGTKIAAASEFDPKNVSVFDVASSNIIYTVNHSNDTSSNHVINSSSFHTLPGIGEVLMTAGVDNVARLWYANTGNPADPPIFAEHSNSVKTAVFNFDGSRVLTASWDSTAKIWNLEQNFLQMDTTDCAFRIASADAGGNDIDFGDVAVGKARDSVVTDFFVNIANFTFEVSDISIINDEENNFKIINQRIYPDTLQGDNPFIATIKFKPQSAGEKTATVQAQIPGKTVEFLLRGNGVEATLLANPDVIDFGNVDIGNLRDLAFQDIITNSSNQSIQIESVSIEGNDNLLFNILDNLNGNNIEGGGNRTLAFRYSPLDEGNHFAYLKIDHSGFDSPLLISMFGTGIVPITDSLTIIIGDVSGEPGGEVQVPIYISNLSENGIQENITGFSAQLKYNNTLLLPQFNYETIDEQYSFKTIKFSIPREFDSDSILTRLPFKVGLGNDTISILELTETYPEGSGKIKIEEVSGEFILKGYCEDGGIRLFDNSGTLELAQNSPNPAENITKFDYEVIEIGKTSITIYNSNGELVDTIVSADLEPGKYSILYDTSQLPNGIYFYSLQTPNQKLVKQMLISR